jgi:integrase
MLQKDSEKTILFWVEKFEKHYFNCRAKTPASITTWKGDYLKVYKKLPFNEFLTACILENVIISSEPDTRSRKRYCMALQALAKFAGLDFDAKPFSGKYSSKTVKPRILPDDHEIVACQKEIVNPQWKWAYGMIATFGLRPHELFHIDQEKFKTSGLVYVCKGKTGERLVFPFYPEWVEAWDLKNIQSPQVSGSTNSDLGMRVTRAFSRLRIPFPAYHLRHCWAVRTIDFGLDISLASMQMGHSTKVHTDLYHRWITEKHQQRVFDALIAKSDRPRYSYPA